MSVFEIEGVGVSVEALTHEGYTARGQIFADPEHPDEVTATYVRGPGRYDVEANPEHPSAKFAASLGGTGYNLAAVVRTAKKWVAEWKAA